MGLHSHNDADDRHPPKISNSGLSPFVCPELYQPAYGKVLATIFATRRQAGHEPKFGYSADNDAEWEDVTE